MLTHVGHDGGLLRAVHDGLDLPVPLRGGELDHLVPTLGVGVSVPHQDGGVSALLGASLHLGQEQVQVDFLRRLGGGHRQGLLTTLHSDRDLLDHDLRAQVGVVDHQGRQAPVEHVVVGTDHARTGLTVLVQPLSRLAVPSEEGVHTRLLRPDHRGGVDLGLVEPEVTPPVGTQTDLGGDRGNGTGIVGRHYCLPSAPVGLTDLLTLDQNWPRQAHQPGFLAWDWRPHSSPPVSPTGITY